MAVGSDPISSIEGGVVGIGPVTSVLGKAPIVGPEIKKLGGMFKGSGRDFNDAPYGQTVGAEQGNPLRASSIDAASADVGGAAAAGAEAGGLADLAALAAL